MLPLFWFSSKKVAWIVAFSGRTRGSERSLGRGPFRVAGGCLRAMRGSVTASDEVAAKAWPTSGDRHWRGFDTPGNRRHARTPLIFRGYENNFDVDRGSRWREKTRRRQLAAPGWRLQCRHGLRTIVTVSRVASFALGGFGLRLGRQGGGFPRVAPRRRSPLCRRRLQCCTPRRLRPRGALL